MNRLATLAFLACVVLAGGFWHWTAAGKAVASAAPATVPATPRDTAASRDAAATNLPPPSGISPTATPTQAAPPAPLAAVTIRLTGEIDDYNRDQLKLRFDRARKAGAKVVVLEIDTYGGLVSSGLDISRFLKNQNDLRVIAYVDSKAISAGAMIAMACDEIYMTPSGTIGDCAPISVAPGGGYDPLPDTERSKAESPILADFRESAFQNQHDPLLAVAMVSVPFTVYAIENDQGQRRFVEEADFKSLTKDAAWRPVAGEPTPIDGPTTLLTLHTDQAVRYGVAKGSFQTVGDLARSLNLQIVDRYASGAGDWVIAALAGSAVRGVLMTIFLISFFAAVKTPGSGAPEAIAAVSLGLLVGIPLLTGYANWYEVLMIIGGVALIVFEIFVFPGHFVSLIVGGCLLMVGFVLTFVGDIGVPGAWSLPQTSASLQQGVQVTVLGLVVSLIALTWLRIQLQKTPLLKRLVLPGDDAANTAPKITTFDGREDHWPFIGTVGVAVSELKPGGSARFPYGDDTRVVSVVGEDGYVPAGSKIVVREVNGSRVAVRTAP